MPRVNGNTKQRLGPWSPAMVRQIADAVNSISDGPATSVGGTKSYVLFLARITGATLRTAKTKAWLYDWEEIVVSDDGTYVTSATYRKKSSLVTTYGKAINGNEGPQTIGAETILGPGVTAVYVPTGFSYNAIANNTVVLMHALTRTNGQPLYFFNATNPIDGQCPAFTGGDEGGGAGEQEI